MRMRISLTRNVEVSEADAKMSRAAYNQVATKNEINPGFLSTTFFPLSCHHDRRKKARFFRHSIDHRTPPVSTAGRPLGHDPALEQPSFRPLARKERTACATCSSRTCNRHV